MLHDGVAVRRPCINAVGEKLDMGRSSCKTGDVEDYRVRHQCFGEGCSAHPRAVCTPTKGPSDGSAESAHRKRCVPPLTFASTTNNSPGPPVRPPTDGPGVGQDAKVRWMRQ
jgi:hypothetical protein